MFSGRFYYNYHNNTLYLDVNVRLFPRKSKPTNSKENLFVGITDWVIILTQHINTVHKHYMAEIKELGVSGVVRLNHCVAPQMKYHFNTWQILRYAQMILLNISNKMQF